MIGSLTGKIKALTAPMVLMNVGGVGYEIETPLSTFCQLKLEQEFTLWTHLVVREDAQLLYGFLNIDDKSLFRILLKVNGVGPKMAVGILSAMTAHMLVQAIELQDIASLTRIPGVGKKTAERLVIELRDRLQTLHADGSRSSHISSMGLGLPSPIAEAESALVALGYKPVEAQRAVRGVSEQHTEASDIIRAALKSMLKS